MGLELARSINGIALNQRKYVLDLLTTFGYLDCKPTGTLMVLNHKLQNATDTDELVDSNLYRQLIGKLLYLTFTRPDISYAARILSQFMDKPSVIHMKAAHRVLRYLKGSPGNGIFFPANNSTLQLQVYTNRDYRACLDTRRSVSGFCVFLGTSLQS